MRKPFFPISILGLLAIVLFACKEPNKPGVLTIQPKTLEMVVGDMQRLSLVWNDQAVETNAAQWSSSDASIAFVSGGIVEALQAGGAVVKATYQSTTAECFVIVNGEPEQPQEDLSKSVKYLPKSAKRGVNKLLNMFYRVYFNRILHNFSRKRGSQEKAPLNIESLISPPQPLSFPIGAP